ncbi:MAG: uracil-DNA glycosylase [archaeon]
MLDPCVEDNIEKLNAQIRICTRCRLSRTRRNAVPGEGATSLKVLFVGEGPGRNEDLEGRPFVGRAGIIFDELLASINLDRRFVYITNIVKCRPTTASVDKIDESKMLIARDRKPQEDEIDACAAYLTRQIEILKPKVICALGDTASSSILRRYGLKPSLISTIHGRACSVASLKIVTMYHPAAALYTATLKEIMKSDFKILAGLLRQSTLI